MRQYQGEMEQRREQVTDLRDAFRAMGRDVEDLNAVLQGLQRLDDDQIVSDPRQMALIHEDMLDQLKRIEFGLRREVEGATERGATLTGNDDVPEGFRDEVEEYYRQLARTQTGAPR
jgi:uncharacterized protein (DUF2461 family)